MDSAVGQADLTATRRREAGSSSARSQLLTVLGEFVYPARQPVWTSALLDALGALGHEQKSARQSLNRTAAEGLVESTRHGRRVLWTLTERGEALLADGTARIYGFQAGDRAWDGQWLVLSVPIPETQRALRHRLRTRLSWLGLGTPTPGLWISADSEHVDQVHEVIRELGLEQQAASWVGPSAGIGAESATVRSAWDLDAVREEYLDFLDDFESREPHDDVECFVAQVELVHAWRRFPFLDPALPPDLLEADWPGARAATTFHTQHAEWKRGAALAWRRFVKKGGPRPEG